jgi:hypothetical protein
MYRSKRTTRSVVAELRMLALRTGVALGIAGAAWHGIGHPGRTASCPTGHGPHRPDPLAACIDHAAGAVIFHWAVIFAVGMVLGLIGGLALALMIPGPVRSRA